MHLRADIWFHRYDQDGKDIEGRCITLRLCISTIDKLLIIPSDDYNSWQESFWGRWKRRNLPKDVILAEGISPSSMLISSSFNPKLTPPTRLQRIQHAPPHPKLDGRSTQRPASRSPPRRHRRRQHSRQSFRPQIRSVPSPNSIPLPLPLHESL